MTNYDEQIWKLIDESAAVAHLTTVKNTAELFRANGEELIEFVEIAGDPYVATEIWSGKNRDQLRTAQVELGRLLFNFVASAVAMQEHVGHMVNMNYKQSEFAQQVKDRMQSHFAQDDLSRFVRDLRRYYLHLGHIPVRFTVRIENIQAGEGSMTHEMILERDGLLGIRGFDPCDESKRFLEDEGPSIILRDVVERFLQHGVAFCAWFSAELRKEHTDELERLDILTRERDQKGFPRDVESYEILSKEVARPEQLFLGYVDPADYREILERLPHAAQRAEAFLRMTEQRIDIDEEVRDRVHALFRDHYAEEE